ncbi:MAG: PP2C family protein-serine/threonine phosphatase [Chloroflexota bacterium]
MLYPNHVGEIQIGTLPYYLERDLALAKQIQKNFLPHELPPIEGIEIYADTRPAHQVGGDLYDYFLQPSNNLTFIVGDISYKGVSAALLMAVMRKVVKTSLKLVDLPTPASILEYINADMFDDLTRNSMLATAIVGQYRPETRVLTYTNAGHSPVIYKPAHEPARLLKSENVPVGVQVNEQFIEKKVVMAQGDLLIVLTDGYIEMPDNRGKHFGYERLLEVIDSAASQQPSGIAHEIVRAFNRFGAGLHHDDQTLLIIKGVNS